MLVYAILRIDSYRYTILEQQTYKLPASSFKIMKQQDRIRVDRIGRSRSLCGTSRRDGSLSRLSFLSPPLNTVFPSIAMTGKTPNPISTFRSSFFMILILT